VRIMKKILIVEDEPVIATVYRNKFTRCGFAVEVASDGMEGLQKIASWQPDLILLDIMLPRVNGLELLKRIRSEEATCSIPVIVYSNAFTASIADEARRLGASHLLSKSDTRPNQVIDFASALLQVDIAPCQPPLERDRETHLIQARQTVAEMREMLRACLRQNDSGMLADLRQKTRLLGAMAWQSDVHRVARLAEGLEALLRTLCEHPAYITFSTDKSVLQTIECLGELMNSVEEASAPIDSASVLVVDDQEVSLHAAQLALKNARLPSTGILDSETAVRALQNSSFDLVLLDIDMPNIDGMALCAYMRTLPNHRDTPVVFFSQLSEIAYRLGSSAVGGNDFIGKPFLTIELAVKALTWIVKPRGPVLSSV
jgi:CheY-like chemotaxis protein